MGTIKVEPPATLIDEYAAERCVGNGGHIFERQESTPEELWYVICECCGAEGVA